MPLFYKRTFIDLGKTKFQHGHSVYPQAHYKPGPGDAIPIVYKKNKYSKPALSRFEVAFGELARIFLAPDLTPPQVLVKNDKQEIVGVACEHLSHTIARREMLPSVFYSVAFNNSNQRLTLDGLDVRDSDEIPFYFLNNFGPTFFKSLCDGEEQGQLSLDIESIAEVLAGSYSLEEDDLHKGNLGFYLVKKDTKPHLVFFKVDHDMMLADSVMSHYSSRYYNLLLGPSAFEVSRRDLVNFPRLIDSQNYYWPTVNRSLGKGNKSYTSGHEVQAFVDLATIPAFRRCKWLAFYKHVLIPPLLIQQSLAKHLDITHPDDRAELALITQSVVARQAKLRAVLFSIPEFREVINSLTESDHQVILQRMLSGTQPINTKAIEEPVVASMRHHQGLCRPGGGFVQGDTPLHAAIRLHDYRYHETWQSFGYFHDQKNALGQTALDLAVSMAQTPQDTSDDIRTDVTCIMKHLLKEGARATDAYQAFVQSKPLHLNDYLFHSSYAHRASQLQDVAQLKLFLRELGEDYRYSLKMQKELAVIAVRQFFRHHQDSPHLKSMLFAFKLDLNGTHKRPPAAELQFIRQLRSQLWIVRLVRGLLGGTATQVQLNKLIDTELKRITPCCWSFFSTKKTPERHEESVVKTLKP